MSDKFWMVYVEGNRMPTKIHSEGLEGAKREGERLANLPDNRGKKVFIMESLCYCHIPKPPEIWHIIDEELPF